MNVITRRILIGSCLTLTLAALVAVAQQMPRTTKEAIKGTATVTTEQLTGTVVQVEGNNLVVQMSTGELRHLNNIPDSRRAMIDGKEVGVRDLKPGTKLVATITTTQTSVTDRTTTVGTGKVWYVAPPTVILTLPNGENRMYKVEDSYRFNVGGKKATVFELRKGMIVSAEKIVEEPRTEIASNTVVTGSAPVVAPVKAEVARQLPVERPAPTPVAAPAPAPAPVAEPAPTPELPKTGSPLPLVGVLGVLFLGAGLCLRVLRQS
jgi:hypothetical protein